MHTQTLSFAVRIARTRNELQAACRVRALSYGHHVPQLHATLMEPDLLDADEHTIVVLCVDKLSGEAVGTARFQTNAGGPLLIEHSMNVPDAMRSDTRAEITRLSAVAGADPLVKLCLMKASYLFCLATQVRWMVIGARSDALVRQYRRLGFADVFDDGRLVPLLHAGRLDHRVLAFNVTTAECRWRDRPASALRLHDRNGASGHPAVLDAAGAAAPRTRAARATGQLAGRRGSQQHARAGPAGRLSPPRPHQLSRAATIRPAPPGARSGAARATGV